MRGWSTPEMSIRVRKILLFGGQELVVERHRLYLHFIWRWTNTFFQLHCTSIRHFRVSEVKCLSLDSTHDSLWDRAIGVSVCSSMSHFEVLLYRDLFEDNRRFRQPFSRGTLHEVKTRGCSSLLSPMNPPAGFVLVARCCFRRRTSTICKNGMRAKIKL